MIRLLRFCAAYLCYGIGDGLYRLGMPYIVYNWLLLLSSDVQGPSAFGPWKNWNDRPNA